MLGVLRAFAFGQHPSPTAAGVASWVVYWDPQRGLESLEDHASELEEVSVFAHHFDERCRLVAATPQVPDILQTLRARFSPRRPRVLATVVNDFVSRVDVRRLKDPECVHQMLASPEAAAVHLDQLLQVAVEADGIELDYENLQAEDREAFSNLVRELAHHLHAQGKWLSVVVQPKTDDRIRDGAGALDWRAIGRHADRLSLMAYHFHHARGSPGPVAPPAWVEAITRFAMTKVPKEKLSLVLTLHGFDWGQGEEGQPLDHDAAMQLATLHGAPQQRDQLTETPHFEYTAGGRRHEVWFEDGASLRKKMGRLRRMGVSHFGLWHLGAGRVPVRETLQAAREKPR